VGEHALLHVSISRGRYESRMVTRIHRVYGGSTAATRRGVSSQKAGAIIYDSICNKKRFFKNKHIIVPMKNSETQRKVFNSLWWDNDCFKIINKRKMSYKKFVCHPSRENLFEYRKVSMNTRKEIKRKKRENFKNFVSNLNLVSSPGLFWTIKAFRVHIISISLILFWLTNKILLTIILRIYHQMELFKNF